MPGIVDKTDKEMENVFKDSRKAERFVMDAFNAYFLRNGSLPVSFLKQYGRGKAVSRHDAEGTVPGIAEYSDMVEKVDFDLCFQDVTVRVDVKTTELGHDRNFAFRLDPRSRANMFACVFKKDWTEGKAVIYVQRRSVINDLVCGGSVRPYTAKSGIAYFVFDKNWFERVDMTEAYTEWKENKSKEVPDMIPQGTI